MLWPRQLWPVPCACRLGPVVLAAASFNTVALQGNGTLVCFGLDNYGQCQAGEDLGPVTAVAAVLHHTVAVNSDGSAITVLPKAFVSTA